MINPVLESRQIMIIEDEYLLASELGEVLKSAGAKVIGPVPTSARAKALIERSRPDCIVSDINLSGESVFPFARWALAMGLPMLFVSGYDRTSLPPDLAAVELIRKPVDLTRLVSSVQEMIKPV